MQQQKCSGNNHLHCHLLNALSQALSFSFQRKALTTVLQAWPSLKFGSRQQKWAQRWAVESDQQQRHPSIGWMQHVGYLLGRSRQKLPASHVLLNPPSGGFQHWRYLFKNVVKHPVHCGFGNCPTFTLVQSMSGKLKPKQSHSFQRIPSAA